ncbi:MAG: NADH-quinone oxidoreductase subunit C [Planctomycetes bacterium]|nr:NADH-quinone oxidoreductase subunit C [Planctomycetota bacterium]
MPPNQALSQEEIVQRIKDRFGNAVTGAGAHGGQSHVVVKREEIIPILTFLKNDRELQFDFLADVTIVDHLYLEVPDLPERFAVVYSLASMGCGHRFRVKAAVPESDPRLDSACALWKAALWGEREAHDMFGIEFTGNPDLRRLLMPADYNGFPLRKDYPLRGRGERESFQQYRRGAD